MLICCSDGQAELAAAEKERQRLMGDLKRAESKAAKLQASLAAAIAGM